MDLTNEEKKVQIARASRYGDHRFVHANLGLMWTGILQSYYSIELSEPIPAHVVLLMMTASKLNRACAEKEL